MNNRILEIVKDAREERLNSISNKYASNPDHILLGRCRKNSIFLRNILDHKGFSTRVGGGLIESEMWTKNKPDSFYKAIKGNSTIHYWVEVNENYICEMASEYEEYYGDPIVIDCEPEDLGYLTFKDSYDGYENKVF